MCTTTTTVTKLLNSRIYKMYELYYRLHNSIKLCCTFSIVDKVGQILKTNKHIL